MAGMIETPGTSNVGTAMGTTQMGLTQPNFYVLSGPGVSIRYNTESHWVPTPPPAHRAPPELQYQDTQVTRDFFGQDIRSQETEIGTLVTVTIQMTIDAGATTATLLLPRINVSGMQQVRFHTYLIWTRHSGPVVPVGPVREMYNIVPLTGTAQRLPLIL